MATNTLRRKRFRAALALAGKTQQDFAEELGVTSQHLSLVLSGARESQRVTDAADAFITRHLPERARASA